jgi:N-methylhydantoinase A
MTGARIGVDVGGTFTDLVLIDDAGTVSLVKLPSTPHAPDAAVITGIQQILHESGLNAADVTEVLHGTTVGSNTLLQKSGARTGLITTRGFRDVLEIGRVRTPTMFDLTWSKPEPLVQRRFRREVDERITASGEILRPVAIDEVLAIGEEFRAGGIEAVAICFLNSYLNPENERRALEAFSAAFPEIWVTASISVLPQIREYERTSTTVVNAYVLPALRQYFTRLEEGLRDIGVAAPLLISNSNGGLAAAKLAREKPVFFISSGRSAGVAGGARLAEAVGEPDLVVFDMGGTTASAALVQDGEVTRTNEYEFRAGISTSSRFIKAGGYLMQVPTIDVAEVGSGAGSIAWLDAGGLLAVGPISAGARPGPACYGLGGDQPTVTDANVALGFLPPKLAGGTLSLDVDAARGAIERSIAKPFKLSVEDAALGIRDIVNVNMARAIRAVTVERGVDPRDFTLLAFGGSGPVHACDLARALGIGKVLFPRAPGVFTAMGMLAGRVERDFIRVVHQPVGTLDPRTITHAIDSLKTEAAIALGEEGFAEDRISHEFELDMRYQGQDCEIQVALDQISFDAASLRARFLQVYRAIYGYVSRDEVEIVNLRLRAFGTGRTRLDFRAIKVDQLSAAAAPASARPIFFSRESGWVETPVIDRVALTAPRAGPLVLQSIDTTIIVPPGAEANVDPAGNVVVSF